MAEATDDSSAKALARSHVYAASFGLRVKREVAADRLRVGARCGDPRPRCTAAGRGTAARDCTRRRLTHRRTARRRCCAAAQSAAWRRGRGRGGCRVARACSATHLGSQLGGLLDGAFGHRPVAAGTERIIRRRAAKPSARRRRGRRPHLARRRRSASLPSARARMKRCHLRTAGRRSARRRPHAWHR